MRFVDLFAGLGGFHLALTQLGHECVFASELDEELRSLYSSNFPKIGKHIYGDIRLSKHRVPKHDILCAGFPCQPFSKSGEQHGRRDRTRGTLFSEIVDIVARQRPQLVLLENVGNFERHAAGRTWQTVKSEFQQLGYHVRGTEHKASGGHGLISPHHFGYPHHRERFFAIASLNPMADDPFPRPQLAPKPSLDSVVQSNRELTGRDKDETSLTELQVECIEHWNLFLRKVPSSVQLPSFPIWGDELWQRYPTTGTAPAFLKTRQLRKIAIGLSRRSMSSDRDDLLATLPAYARRQELEFPRWKSNFIRQNREFFGNIRKSLDHSWIAGLQQLPPSLRKLEWNCKGEERNLWRHVLQFRPSGLRVKRYSSIPALVAMTTTQIPILGPKRRFITRVEGLRLQQFPDNHRLPARREKAFAALGNAVHVSVVKAIMEQIEHPGHGENARSRWRVAAQREA